MTHLYLDIETIPTSDEKIIADVVEGIKPPSNYKDEEKIAAYIECKKGEAVSKTSFDGAYGQICCIGWAVDEHKPTSLNSPNEGQLIKDVFDLWERRFDVHHPLVVGHNILGFDLPFIRKRAMVHGIKLPHWFPQDFKPWSQSVFDTMFQWDQKNFISADKLARVFGLEGKGDIDGSMIADLWTAGEHDKIAEYCRSDVELTRQIHTKMQRAL